MKPLFLLLTTLALAESLPTAEPSDWMMAGDVKKSIPVAGELRFDYKVDPAEFGAITLPLPGGFKDANVARFEVRTDGPRTLAVALDEKEGGRWIALVATPKNDWQKVELSAADFALSTGDNEPKDPNGKLDLPKVQSLSVLDMDTLFVRDKSPVAQIFFPDAIAGPRILTLREVSFSASAPAAPGLDGLGRPQAGWLPVGGLRVKRTATSPLGGAALEATYRSGANRVGGMMRPLPPRALASKTALTLSLASEKAATFRLQLEDDRGAKWDIPISVPGEKKKKAVRLALADWTPSQDTKDPDAKFDVARIKQLGLIDASGLAGAETTENTLWLSGLSASPEK
jgi:hypothetical protein